MNGKQNGVSFGLVAIYCLLCGGAGCDSPLDPTPAKPGVGSNGHRTIGVSFQTMNNPFFIDLNAGLKSVVDAHDDTLVTLDAQFNSLKQKNDISDLILRGASVIFVNPVNWEGIKGSLIQAKEKGIPVIVVDAPVRDEELILSTVASDNVEAGRLAARALARAVKPPGRIGVLEYSINKACIDRVEGFKEEIAKHAGMEIADVQEGKGTTESARPVLRDMMGRHPDLNAVFAINDPGALGVISALESAGKLGGVRIAAVDGAREAVEAIQNGKMLSTSAQFPGEIGRKAAETAYDHFAGKPVEKNIKIKVELITKENADAFLKTK